MRWPVPVVLLAASCQITLNLHHVGPLPGDAGPDAAIDAAPSADACTFGSWSAPLRIAANNPSLNDMNPALSPDGKVVVWELWTTPTDADLYYAFHTGTDFTTPMALPSNLVGVEDRGPFWSADGTHLYFTQGSAKMVSEFVNGQFGPATTTLDFDTIQNYFERPRFSSDGLELVFYDGSPSDLVHAIRGSTTSTTWTQSPLPSLSSPYTDDTPTLSGDSLTIYYSSRNTGSGATPPRHLFMAHRAMKEGQFDPPSDLGDFGVAQPVGPDISRDGTTMLFTGYPNSQADTYMMTRSCQ